MNKDNKKEMVSVNEVPMHVTISTDLRRLHYIPEAAANITVFRYATRSCPLVTT